MLGSILMFLGAFAFIAAALAYSADRALRARGWKGPASDHFDGTRFRNKLPPKGGEERSSRDVLKWMLSRRGSAWERRNVSPSKPRERVAGREIAVTFINHSTVLIQTEGLNIITDPVYAQRASPVSFLGPRRYAEPGVAWEDLPPIDIVLLTHNHYDHMDVRTLSRLKKRFDPAFVAPLGNAGYLASKGISCADLDWWQSVELKGISIRLVPAQHFSARAMSDRDKTLWGGYVAAFEAGDLYFAGDTGYGPFVEDIRREYPRGFRLGFLPIGAFKPEWFMKEVHIGPEEAVKMCGELGITDAVAIHHSTFKLADDGQDEPRKALEAIKESKAALRFHVLSNGETILIR